MKHHPVFNKFNRKKVKGTGNHVFDFLGVATRITFKRGLERYALKMGMEVTPSYPSLNEHYFDWVALLTCLLRSENTFRMAELGAGWAPWLVRASAGARQITKIKNLELLGVEADHLHYHWMQEHFIDNQLEPNNHFLINGAVTTDINNVKFPKLINPEEDYGASILPGSRNSDYIEVPGFTLESLLSRFSGPVDFMHVDIQGSEYDVIPTAMHLLKKNVKSIMVGTHLSKDKHDFLYNIFTDCGWRKELSFPRNEEVKTNFGIVKFGDGFQFWRNSEFVF